MSVVSFQSSSQGSNRIIAAVRRYLIGKNRWRGLILWTLPGLAALAAILLLLWSDLILDESRMVVSNMDIAAQPMRDDLMMVNPKIAGTDRNGRPYVLSADRAIQPKGQIGVVRLEAPKADLTQNSGKWVALNGTEGELNRNLDILDLFGTINIFRDDGMAFETTGASIDLKKGEASGDAPIHGQGKFGLIDAEGGFELYGGGSVIIFRGKSTLHLYGSGQEDQG